MRLWFPTATVFVASAAVMVVELTGGRLIASHTGTSLYTWTSAIGVVLGGLALGNYVGGRVADRYRARAALTVQFAASAVLCLAVLPLDRTVWAWEPLWSLHPPARIACHMTLVFLWPATMLGTIGPVAAKWALNLGRSTGRSVGNVYAWGALGSITGTFLAGYVLIVQLGTPGAVVAAAAVLAVWALGFRPPRPVVIGWLGAWGLVLLITVGPWAWARSAAERLALRRPHLPWVLYETESPYSFIQVSEPPGAGGRRELTLDVLVHSRIRLDDPAELDYGYHRLYAAVTERFAGKKPALRTLTMGGGGVVFPRYLLHRWPGSHCDVAEIDPAVTEAAHAAFGLPRDTPIAVYNYDARNYLADLHRRRREGKSFARYDFIYEDALSHISVPFHHTTREFNELVAGVLAPDGVYLINMIDTLESGRLLGAMLRTLADTFPHVAVVLDAQLTDRENGRQTFVIVASRQPLDRLSEPEGNGLPGTDIHLLPAAQMAALRQRTPDVLLTDNYAPVENLLAPVVRRFGKGIAVQHWEAGITAAALGRRDNAINHFRRALVLRPDHVVARLSLAGTLCLEGRFDEARTEFETALALDPSNADAHDALARLLQARGEPVGAERHFRSALQLNPGLIRTRYALAVLLRDRGRVDEAITELRQVIERDRRHVAARNDLAGILLERGALDEAVVHLRDALRIDPGFALAYCNLAVIRATRGDSTGARQLFDKALAVDERCAQAHAGLGTLLFNEGQAAAALLHFRKAHAIDPDLAGLAASLEAAQQASGG